VRTRREEMTSNTARDAMSLEVSMAMTMMQRKDEMFEIGAWKRECAKGRGAEIQPSAREGSREHGPSQSALHRNICGLVPDEWNSKGNRSEHEKAIQSLPSTRMTDDSAYDTFIINGCAQARTSLAEDRDLP
jgi:hypothetical protein